MFKILKKENNANGELFPSYLENSSDKEEWFRNTEEEGELRVDVYDAGKTLVVKSTIAGIQPEDLDININNDLLTIRGRREADEIVNENQYFHRECYWGTFSRSIILPVEVRPEKIKAYLKNGVLTITLPKGTAKRGRVRVKEIE